MRRDVGLAIAIAMSAAGCGAPRIPDPAAVTPPVDVRLTARGLAFEPALLQVPAGGEVRLRFENTDIGVGHALVVHGSGPSAAVARIPPTVGPDLITVALGRVPAGAFRLTCAIHAQMTASLVAS